MEHTLKNLPTIKLKKDMKNEIRLFKSFLNHPYFVQNRNYILKVFPEIKEIAQDDDFENKLSDFITNFYKQNEEKIKLIKINNENILKERANQAFELLSNLMDYEWDNKEYSAYLTILPFSPFEKDIFYYSILAEIKNKNIDNKSLLSVGIHEISHMIFYEYLKKIENKHNFILNTDAKNYIKEAITTALLNHKKFQNIFEMERSKGNPEIQELYIKNSSSQINLSEFIETLWYTHPFKNFIENLILSIHASEKEFQDKRLLWNKHGREIFKNEDLLKEYQIPINLNMEKLL